MSDFNYTWIDYVTPQTKFYEYPPRGNWVVQWAQIRQADMMS